MNTNRTFGIELEVLCENTPNALVTALNQLFNSAESNHKAVRTGYCHSVDALNTTIWEIKNDSSLSSNFHSHPYCLEVVSPVLKGKAGIESLRLVANFLDTVCKINRTCGLHVHHGVNKTEMKNTATAWLKMEKTILQCLPLSRRENSMCKSWASKLHCTNPSTYDLQTYDIRSLTYDRYTSLNLSSFSLRSTVEFRCAAGTSNPEKAINWVLATQAIVDNAQKEIPATLDTIDAVVDFIKNGSNDLPIQKFRSPIKKRAQSMFESGCYTPEEVKTILMHLGASENYALTILSDSKSTKWTYFGKITKVVDGCIKFVETSGVDTDYVEAATWLKSRHTLMAA